MLTQNEKIILSEKLIDMLPAAYRHLVETPTYEHAFYLGPRLRRADLDEIKAGSGNDGTGSLLKSASCSEMAWTFFHPETLLPHTMAGAGHVEGICRVWLLCMPYDVAMKKFILSVYQQVIDYMHKLNPLLVNWVDVRHVEAISWLKRAGFTLSGPEPFGVEGRPFYKLIHEVKNV